MIVLRGGSQVKEIEVGVREVKWRFVGGLITGFAEKKILNIINNYIILYYILYYITCSRCKGERLTTWASIQSIDIDFISGSWLQTYRMQNHMIKSISVFKTNIYPAYATACKTSYIYCYIYIVILFCTSNGVGAWIGFNGSLDRVMAAHGGCGLYQEARDGLGLGAPGESDGGVLHIGYTDTSRWTDVWENEI